MKFLPLALAISLSTATAGKAQSQSPLVAWLPFQEALNEGSSSDKKVLVDIFAPWCSWCAKMQKEAYMDEEVLSYLREHFVAARLDISVENDTLTYSGMQLPSAYLAAGFGAEGTPTTVFLTASGDYITRLPGYASPSDFLSVLKFIASDSYLTQSYEEFSASK
ncbi:MAG: DUF255 domain-containing protein [Bacteroidetes bacterium]|nr:DUF255 domain-containing protein [Bacteroidota bacterium]